MKSLEPDVKGMKFYQRSKTLREKCSSKRKD